MLSDTYNHLIEIDDKLRVLSIYRIRGEDRELYTSVKLPNEKWKENPDAIQEFCQTLGENILLDSPKARELLDL